MAILKKYNNPEFLRFWAQTVLPTLYDDSLSYYEVLSKVVKWLNETIQQMEITQENLATVNAALEVLTQDVRNLEGRVDIAEADITQLKADLKSAANRITAVEQKNAQQDSRLDAVEAKNTAQDESISAIQQKNATQDESISAIEKKNTEQDTQITAIQEQNTEQDRRLTAVEAANTEQNTRLSAVEAKNKTQDTRLDGMDAKNATQDADITAATETAGDAMTEAAAAKSAADAAKSTADDALAKVDAAVASSGPGGVVFSAPLGATLNFATLTHDSGRTIYITWHQNLSIMVGGKVYTPAVDFSLSTTDSGSLAVVLDKGATALNSNTLHIIPVTDVIGDSHIPLFTFNFSTPGFIFGRGCTFPMPYQVEGVLTTSNEPRYYAPGASAYNPGNSDAPAPSTDIKYAPPGSTCILMPSDSTYNIATSIYDASVHVRLQPGAWTFMGSSADTVQWLSLAADFGTPSIKVAPRSLTFKGPVRGISFPSSGTYTFEAGADDCSFTGGSVYTLNAAPLRNCEFSGDGAIGAATVFENCHFAINNGWNIPDGCTLYNCFASGVTLGGKIKAYGGYIRIGNLSADLDLYIYNAALDCNLGSATLPYVGTIEIDVLNSYIYTLAAPKDVDAILTGSGAIVDSSFATEFDTSGYATSKVF